MKLSRKGRGALSVVTAGALVVSLGACDQIQSLWKSEKSSGPVAEAPVAQAPKPVEGTIEVAKSAEPPKIVEAPKIDENKLLVGRIKSALGADPALKFLAIDATASEGAVTLYGTADTRARREKAAKIVAKVPGVKSVKNELVIVAGS